MSNAKEVNDSNFETESEIRQTGSGGLLGALVRAFQGHCPGDRGIGDGIRRRIKITKCNVDENPATPGKYGIKAIPTLLFFKGGDLVDQVRGMVPKDKIEES